MLWLSFIAGANAQDTFFVSVRNNNWNVVFRSSSTGARIERMAGRCGTDWVNACALKYTPVQRSAALRMGPTQGADSCHAIRLAPMNANGFQALVMQIDVANFCGVLQPGSVVSLPFQGPAQIPDATLRPPADDDLDRLLNAPDPPTGPPSVTSRPVPFEPAPSTVVDRGEARPRFTPPPNEPAVVQQAVSMEELRLLEEDLDAPKVLSEAERKERDKEERRRKRRGEATELKDRRVPGL